MRRRRAEATGRTQDSVQVTGSDIPMNTAGFRISVRRMMGIVAVAALVLSLATGSRTTLLSCHLCHNRKHVTSRLVLGIPVLGQGIMDTRFPAEDNHQHTWTTYGSHTKSFLLGERAAGRPDMYVDGSHAPDFNP
jgi:hypothetical protein